MEGNKVYSSNNPREAGFDSAFWNSLEALLGTLVKHFTAQPEEAFSFCEMTVPKRECTFTKKCYILMSFSDK